MKSLNRQVPILILIPLVWFSNISLIFTCQANSNELPNQENLDLYINNLISSYNSLVKFYDVFKPYFSDYKEYFSLYLDVGHSFRVICVKSDENDTSSINLIFLRIQSDSPDIILDFNRSLNDYVDGLLMSGHHNIARNYLIYYLDSIAHSHLILSISSEEIIKNTTIDSKKFAEEIYKMDRDKIRRERINVLWDPFIESNMEIIDSIYNLSALKWDIQSNIYQDENYVYEIFLQEFNEFIIMVNHYKELPMMMDKYEEFINSEQMKKINLEEFLEVKNKLMSIKDNMLTNEQYLFEDFESDLHDLENTITIELQRQALSEERLALSELRQTLSEVRQVLAEEKQARTKERRFTILMAIITTSVGTIGGIIGGYYFHSWMSRRKEINIGSEYTRIELEDIKGIGKIKANLLRDNGIPDVEAFYIADKEKIQKIRFFNEVNIPEYKKQAEELLKKER